MTFWKTLITSKYSLGLISFLLVAIVSTLIYLKFNENKVLIMATGSKEGFYYKMGKSIKEIVEKETNYKVELLYTKGSQHNLQLLNMDSVDLAIIQGDIVTVNSEKSIIPLFPEILHVIVRKNCGFSSYEEVLENQICIGGQGSGMNTTNRRILSHFTPLRKMKLCESPFTETINRMLNNEIDIGFFFTGLNSSGLSRILNSHQFEHIGLDNSESNGGNIISLITKYPLYYPFVLPKNYYGSQPKSPIFSLSSPAMMITNSKLPSSTAYDLSKIIYENRTRISQKSEISLDWGGNLNYKNLTTPLHEGSSKYFFKDEPSFLERYVEVISLFATLFISLGSLAFARLRLFKKRNQKNLDELTYEIKEIYDKLYAIDHMTSMDNYDLSKKVIDIKKRALNLLAKNEVREDEEFLIWQNELNHLILIISNFNKDKPAYDRVDGFES